MDLAQILVLFLIMFELLTFKFLICKIMLKPTQVVTVIIKCVNTKKNMYQSLANAYMHFLSLNSLAKPREGNSPCCLHYILLQAQSYEIKDGGGRESFEIKSICLLQIYLLY